MVVYRLIMVLLLLFNASFCMASGGKEKIKKAGKVVKKATRKILDKMDTKTPSEVKEVTNLLRDSKVITSREAKKLKKVGRVMNDILGDETLEEALGDVGSCLTTSCCMVFAAGFCAATLWFSLNS